MHADLARKINALRGPVLVLGASGFLGANLMRSLLQERSDVFGTAFSLPAWRLEGVPDDKVLSVDLLAPQSLQGLIQRVRPGTVFDCVGYGGYAFEQDAALIYETNLAFKTRLAEILREKTVYCYIHAGSSAEYGPRSDRPSEGAPLQPGSPYAVAKAAATGLIYYLGKHQGLRCANLRFCSIYGPFEERTALIPGLVVEGVNGKYPPLPSPECSADFLFVEDACEAFLDAALNLQPEDYGEAFNVGSGERTTVQQLAEVARRVFALDSKVTFSPDLRPEEELDGMCCANPGRAKERLGWSPRTTLVEGIVRTAQWYKSLPDRTAYDRHAKGFQGRPGESISAIVCCYKDLEAIPSMYQRLVQVFEKLHMDYEIVFVNNGSPDNTEEVIQELSSRNPRVIGLSLSRNFGSQAAFRSGLELATKRACVLLDGDLQDPPELIEQFVEKWREGYEVVYGRRVKREATLLMQAAYKLFYLVFNRMSYVYMPRDAGDFSLIDRPAVCWMLECKERDLFIRGVRAFVGFRQIGVDYVRPERMFGRSTNNLFKNIGWAKKGILSFSNVPLTMLTSAGIVLFAVSLGLGFLQALSKLLFPQSAPHGITTIVLLVLTLGSLNLLAISVVGEYIAKIFEEVKGRPPYIRMNIIKNGEVRRATQPAPDERR